MASIEEKQIAKEILLAMIEHNGITLYADHTKESDAQNVQTISDAFAELVKTVSQN
jgi:hypothetical protein